MIRRTATLPELNIDSLTDMMTNTTGLILLMVVVSSIITGGIKITLLHQLRDPGNKKPIYLVCRNDQVLFMHRGDQWAEELADACGQLENRLGRKPTTSEALAEVNRFGFPLSPDVDSVYVREVIRERGRKMHVIGVRFLACDIPVEQNDSDMQESDRSVFTPAARRAFDDANASTEYLDLFVYEDEFDTLLAVQKAAEQRGLGVGWRVLLEHENPGLSETGIPGHIPGSD